MFMRVLLLLLLLLQVLQASNVSVSFTPAAQFSRMSAESPLYVTEVLHSVSQKYKAKGCSTIAFCIIKHKQCCYLG
jgi:hypothetical protein